MLSVVAPKLVHGISVRECRPAVRAEVLVHDGKHLVVRHGPEAHTGTGNPNFTMVTGSPKEIDAEISRLDLVSVDPAISDPAAAARR